MTAPKGSLAAFSEVLILNATSGAVLWLQVDNDGCIGCLAGSNELPATIDDRLMVTITDPQGNVITFERIEVRGRGRDGGDRSRRWDGRRSRAAWSCGSRRERSRRASS